MKLKDHIAQLEAQRAAFIEKLQAPDLTAERRTELEDELEYLLIDMQVLAEAMASDRLGYLSWFWADDNAEVQRQVRKYRQ